MIVRDMLKVVRPIVFDNRFEGYEYTTAGSCIVVSARNRIYAVTARHVPHDKNRQYEPSQTMIPYEEGSEAFLPLKESFVISTDENNDTDHKDVVFFEIWQEQLDANIWNPNYCFNLSWNHSVTVTPETKYWVSGYPRELNIDDYETSTLQHQAAHIPGQLVTENRFIAVDEWNLDPANELQSYQGLSGGGAFSCTSISEGKANIRLEGIVLKASVESHKALVLQSRAIEKYILRQQGT